MFYLPGVNVDKTASQTPFPRARERRAHLLLYWRLSFGLHWKRRETTNEGDKRKVLRYSLMWTKAIVSSDKHIKTMRHLQYWFLRACMTDYLNSAKYNELTPCLLFTFSVSCISITWPPVPLNVKTKALLTKYQNILQPLQTYSNMHSNVQTDLNFYLTFLEKSSSHIKHI